MAQRVQRRSMRAVSFSIYGRADSTLYRLAIDGHMGASSDPPKSAVLRYHRHDRNDGGGCVSRYQSAIGHAHVSEF